MADVNTTNPMLRTAEFACDACHAEEAVIIHAQHTWLHIGASENSYKALGDWNPAVGFWTLVARALLINPSALNVW